MVHRKPVILRAAEIARAEVPLVQRHWRPGRAWFAEHCPKLAAIAAVLDRDPKLSAMWAANF